MIETVIDESADILTELVERANEFGYLTTDDIVQLFPQAEESSTLLEELFTFLHDAGVDIHINDGDEGVDLSLIHI